MYLKELGPKMGPEGKAVYINESGLYCLILKSLTMRQISVKDENERRTQLGTPRIVITSDILDFLGYEGRIITKQQKFRELLDRGEISKFKNKTFCVSYLDGISRLPRKIALISHYLEKGSHF